MCSVSVITDEWNRTAPMKWPSVIPGVVVPGVVPGGPYEVKTVQTIPWAGFPPANVSREEFDSLRAEVAELRKLLLAAKEFDSNTGQADCEMEDKIALLKKIAEYVGVDFSDVFTNKE